MKIALHAVGAMAFIGELAAPASAQPTLPPNTIQCSAFQKQHNGSWYVSQLTTFDLGTTKGMSLLHSEVGRRDFVFDGVDLFDVLEKKCGGGASNP